MLTNFYYYRQKIGCRYCLLLPYIHPDRGKKTVTKYIEMIETTKLRLFSNKSFGFVFFFFLGHSSVFDFLMLKISYRIRCVIKIQLVTQFLLLLFNNVFTYLFDQIQFGMRKISLIS